MTLKDFKGSQREEIKRQVKALEDDHTVTIYTRTSKFCEEFEKLSTGAKKAILLILGLKKEQMESQLLVKMNEYITEADRHMTAEDLPELVREEFTTLDLMSKLRFINRNNEPGNNAD